MDALALLETVLAVIAVVVCLVLLVRLAIGPERIARALRWRSARRAAAREARSVIERARRGAADRPEGNWDGNVYRPKNFRRPKKPH
jgi:hypothetical protein